LKARGWEKIFHVNGQDRKVGVSILISDKINFKMKAIKKDKDGHHLMVEGSIQEHHITNVNIYAPNTGAPRYLQKILKYKKGEINGNITIVGNFNIPLTSNGQIL